MYQQSSGSLSELTFDPSESGASVYGVSDGGIITGEEISLQYGLEAGYLTVSGGAVLFTGGSQGHDWAVAANDNGTIIGDFGASGSPGNTALMWTAPGYAETPLPGLRCDHCVRVNVAANAVNSGGSVVGHSSYAVYDNNGNLVSDGLFAVEWQSGTVTNLGSLQDSGASDASGINGVGDIVGGSRVGPATGAPTHAFLYHGGAMTDLGTLQGDTNSSAAAINDVGQIVGTADDGNTSHAFLYEGGQMYDLNALVDPGDPLIGQVTLQAATGISSNGWIAVNGTDSRDTGPNADTTRAFLLIPSH